MRIRVYKCPNCNEEIYSRANHDFKSCKCGKTCVDGGHEENNGKEFFGVWRPYRLIDQAINADTRIVELDVTERQLYDDWNCGTKKYGVVK